jgi:hypothetical protein
MKPCRWLGLALTLLIFAATAHGVITAPYPLKQFMERSDYVVMAKVTSFDAQNKRMILTVTEDIKGKPTFRQVPVLLEGEKDKNRDHPAALMKRLATDLPVMMFILHKKENNSFTTYVFSNGTWFELKGNGNGMEAGVWDLTHGEPYLRRTFKGTTEELRKMIVQNVAGTYKLPGVNEKEAPGFGPEVPQK